MTDLTTIRDRVEQTLVDVSNAIWSATWLDEAITQALSDYALALPQRTLGTFVLASGNLLTANNREIDMDAFGSIEEVREITTIWLPYNVDQALHTPRRFEFYRKEKRLFIFGDPVPAVGDTVRIFYNADYVNIYGLSTGFGKTLRPEHDSVFVRGASGYAAFSRGLDLTEQISITQQTAQEVRLWGKQQIEEYRKELQQLARRQVGRRSRVELPALDKWDKSWS